MKLVSVSPFRAVIKVEGGEDTEDSIDEEEEFQRQQTMAYLDEHIANPAPRNHSPIRTDSQALRGQRENYLQSFNEQLPQRQGSAHQSQERIKKESEYLRG